MAELPSSKEQLNVADKSTADPMIKLRRFLIDLATREASSYFHADGYPRAALSRDAAEFVKVLDANAKERAEDLDRMERAAETIEQLTAARSAPEPKSNPGGTGLEQSPSGCGDGHGDSGLTPGGAGGGRVSGNPILAQQPYADGPTGDYRDHLYGLLVRHGWSQHEAHATAYGGGMPVPTSCDRCARYRDETGHYPYCPVGEGTQQGRCTCNDRAAPPSNAALLAVSQLRNIASTCLAMRPTSGMMRSALERIAGVNES